MHMYVVYLSDFPKSEEVSNGFVLFQVLLTTDHVAAATTAKRVCSNTNTQGHANTCTEDTGQDPVD